MVVDWDLWTLWYIPSGYVKITMENIAIEIVNFPMKNSGSFHSYVAVYQKVRPHPNHHMHGHRCFSSMFFPFGDGLRMAHGLDESEVSFDIYDHIWDYDCNWINKPFTSIYQLLRDLDGLGNDGRV